ncbi:MAG TPA: DNA polymerase/3'-5' exonuclease PolX [Thermoanaerobacterales bacterium]|nr:DNA polymerase/3'-5' exonuclease PolX [Thermoanaerobacterales bacterium]
MKNFEIAFIFSDIADMLEIKGENFFKIRAYRKAAHVIGNLPSDIRDVMIQTPLEEIDGIGKALSGKIQEILKTGTCRFYEDLKRDLPRGLVEMLRIPGLGAKKVRVIYDTLHISSIDELEKAAKSHQLRILPGMGVKTEQTILKGIQMLKGEAGKTLLSTGIIIAEDMVTMLKTMTEVQNVDIVGSLRRRKEMIGNIDILVSSYKPEDVINGFLRYPRIKEIIARGSAETNVRLDLGVQANLRIVEPSSFYCAMQFFTGSKDHNTKLRSVARKMGFNLNEHGIYEEKSGKVFYPESEEELYHFLELPYIIPELREDRGEIEAAMEGRLPTVLEKEDIKGDLHVHTDWSDGACSLETMIDAAKALGYEYIAITDHSKSLKVARGLDEKRLKEQIDIIKKLNKEVEGIRILTGIEMDILSDETMDFDDDILKELDVVIASVHTGFKQDRDKLTRRIIAACENPHVDIIAHPTGRMLGKRDPYDIDMDLIFKVAAETHTILEINSSPDRLDLNDMMAKKAKEKGVKISINTDAHEKEGLKDMRYGIWNARRAWLEKDDVVNAMPLDKLLKELSAR